MIVSKFDFLSVVGQPKFLFGAHLDLPKMYPTGRSVALLHFFKNLDRLTYHSCPQSVYSEASFSILSSLNNVKACININRICELERMEILAWG